LLSDERRTRRFPVFQQQTAASLSRENKLSDPCHCQGIDHPSNIVNIKIETITGLIIFNISVTSRQIQEGYDQIDQLDTDKGYDQTSQPVNKKIVSQHDCCA
jgi:hypothetical protein